MKTNAGIDWIANTLGNAVGVAGTASATSATTLTSTGFTGSNAYAGMVVYAGSVYGIITANTTTVLTVERWVNPATPGGAAGSTPSTTAPFIVMSAAPGMPFMALTANAGTGSATDTALTGEITTAGLTRKVCSFAHTAGTATYTLAVTFTAVSADVPVTVHRAGMFPTLTSSTGIMGWETVLSADAAFNAAGDAATITQTVTIS